jgi:hypothetical protein
MSSEPDTPTRRLLQMDPMPPAVPNRLREALFFQMEDALDEDDSAAIGQWLYSNRDRLERGGDELGTHRFNHEILNVEKHAPPLLRPLRQRLTQLLGEQDMLRRLCVPAFDLRGIEMHATLHHHGGHFVWHDDAVASDGETVMETRRLSFVYYMHSTPKMFSGGSLEFLDGTAIEPQNNRLVLFHPVQQHRVLRVECWSSHVLHGRWAITGWLHGDAPAGYVDRLPRMRGEPTA